MTTGKVYLVGAGPGDPKLITRRGLECLAQAEVIIYDRLVDQRLLAEARPEAERIYVGKTTGHHALRQEEINALLVTQAQAGKVVIRLKGGDPFVFGRGGEEAEALAEAGIPFEIVPGVTSAVAVPAYAGIPLTHRDLASSFTVITGHEDPTKPEARIAWEKLATGADTLVFLMGMEHLGALVAELLRHGRPPTTPVALIRWGTWPHQETIVGSLADIVRQAEAHNFGPPAVVVVGEVVKLREKLAWFERRPLFGKRVLVTRTREQASALSALLAEYGAEAVELPTIELQPPQDWGPLDAALERLAQYAWVVFTSANGVRFFWERLARQGKDARALSGVKLAAIGPATAQALQACGLRPDFVPNEFVAESVASGLIAQGVAGQRVLLARAEEAREVLAQELRRAGAIADEVPAYRTVVPQGVGEALRRLREGEIDIVIFSSSSTVRHLAAMLGEEAQALLARPTIACIGPITARTAQELGLRVDVVAQEYTIEGLVQALIQYVGMKAG